MSETERWIHDKVEELRGVFTRGRKDREAIAERDLPAVLEAVADFVDAHTVVVPEVRVQRGRTLVTVTGRVDRPVSPFADDGALVTAVRALLREMELNERDGQIIARTPRMNELQKRLTHYLTTGRWPTTEGNTPP